MRFFLPQHRGWPGVGVALALGFLVGDCLFVVSSYMEPFGSGSFWPLLAGGLGLYLLMGVGLDLAVQALAPGRARASIWVRGAVVLMVALALSLAAHEVRSLPLLAVAALFAVLALGRYTWPIAALATGIAIYPAVQAAPTLESDRSDASGGAAPALAHGPSFLVVVLDTVRADHTSAYGYHRKTTPNLTRLSARGVRFERAYSTGHWSLPSHASLFTGLLASRHGAHNEHLALDGQHPTLAEILADHGYETANFTGSPWIGPGTGMSRGFQHSRQVWQRPMFDSFLLANRVYSALAAPDRDKGGADTVAGIRNWLAQRDPARPYFLFVNVFEAHAPYQQVPREFRRRFVPEDLSLRDLESIGTRVTTATQNGNRLAGADIAIGRDMLDGAIAAADAVLGGILELVEEEVICVVVSDHGELFGEHTLFGHSNTLYEPLIRVPMVMAGGSLPAGLVVQELVSLVDVMPTLLGLAGIREPEVDGIDLRGVLAEPGRARGREVRAEQFRPTGAYGWRRQRPGEADYLLARKQAVVERGMKRIISEDGSDSGFDLSADPREERPFPGTQTNLAAAVPDPEAGEAAPAIDPFRQKALQLLGYMQ
jgi:arylsulfatase A-like enzyme